MGFCELEYIESADCCGHMILYHFETLLDFRPYVRKDLKLFKKGWNDKVGRGHSLYSAGKVSIQIVEKQKIEFHQDILDAGFTLVSKYKNPKTDNIIYEYAIYRNRLPFNETDVGNQG